jgi:hypothetical protein
MGSWGSHKSLPHCGSIPPVVIQNQRLIPASKTSRGQTNSGEQDARAADLGAKPASETDQKRNTFNAASLWPKGIPRRHAPDLLQLGLLADGEQTLKEQRPTIRPMRMAKNKDEGYQN